MDLDSVPGIVHVAFEVPEWSHVFWLCLPGCVPRVDDQLAVARREGDCPFPKAPGTRISALDNGGGRPGLCAIDREVDPLNRSCFVAYRIALDTSGSCCYGLAFLRRRDHCIECQIF